MCVENMGEGFVDVVARRGGGRSAEREVCKMSMHLDENKVAKEFNEMFGTEGTARKLRRSKELSGSEGCCWTYCWKCGNVSASS